VEAVRLELGHFGCRGGLAPQGRRLPRSAGCQSRTRWHSRNDRVSVLIQFIVFKDFFRQVQRQATQTYKGNNWQTETDIRKERLRANLDKIFSFAVKRRKVFRFCQFLQVLHFLHFFFTFLHFSIWFSQVRNGEGGRAPARQVVVGKKFRIAGKIILRCSLACHSGEKILETFLVDNFKEKQFVQLTSDLNIILSLFILLVLEVGQRVLVIAFLVFILKCFRTLR
jgi:hypothetical protein